MKRTARSDPTGTLPLQKKFTREFRTRWDSVRRMIPDAVSINSTPVNAIQHAALTGRDPALAFQAWIDEAMRQLVLGINGSWTLPYVRAAADQGVQRAGKLLAVSSVGDAFDPDQPRDKDGKWSSGALMYHSTSSAAPLFEKQGDIFVTPSKKYSGGYGKITTPVHVQMDKPFDVNNKELLRQWREERLPHPQGHESIRDYAWRKGYDATIDKTMNEVVVRNIKQLKRAGKDSVRDAAPAQVADRTPALQTLAITELQGIEEAVSQQAVRAFANGMLSRKSSSQIARDIQQIIDSVGKHRSDMLVSFMCVRAYGVATLDQFRAANVPLVGTVPERMVPPSITRDARTVLLRDKRKGADPADLVEVLTAGDNDVCPECQDISDEGPYDLDEAESLIPAHPNCRCAFVPWDDARFASVHDGIEDEPRDEHGRWTAGSAKQQLEQVVQHLSAEGLTSSKTQGGYKLSDGKGVSLRLARWDDRTLSLTDVKSQHQGKGQASSVVQKLTTALDKLGIEVHIESIPYGKGLTKPLLDRFYQKHGFQSANDEIKNHMVRKPKGQISDAFNPDQPRDQVGKWSSGGGSDTNNEEDTHFGYNPEDSPGKRGPSVDWYTQDLQDSTKVIDEESIKRDYVAKKDWNKVNVYRSWVALSDIPTPKLAEVEDGDEEGYDWSEYKKSSIFPPAKLKVDAKGKVSIIDGNHRLHYWEQKAGFEYVPAWIVDYRKTNVKTFTDAFNPDQPRDKDGQWTSNATGDHDTDHPKAGDVVDGLTVLHDVPNQDSIDGVSNDMETLHGIREVSMSSFENSGPPSFYSKTEQARTEKLAAAIKASGEIKPLIVVVEQNNLKAGPYILEGGHRFDALKMLGKKSFPAMVVVDHSGNAAKSISGPEEGNSVAKAMASAGANATYRPLTPVKYGNGVNHTFLVHSSKADKAEGVLKSGGYKYTRKDSAHKPITEFTVPDKIAFNHLLNKVHKTDAFDPDEPRDKDGQWTNSDESKPTVFYKGSNPGDERRIKTGDDTWDSHLFVSSKKDDALNYGHELTQFKAKPEAKILYEGTREFTKVAGKWRKNENMLQYASRAASASKAAGYDATWFTRQGDIGTAIHNPDAFISRKHVGDDSSTWNEEDHPRDKDGKFAPKGAAETFAASLKKEGNVAHVLMPPDSIPTVGTVAEGSTQPDAGTVTGATMHGRGDEVLANARLVAEKQGFDPSKISVSDEIKTFQLNGMEFKYAGAAHLDTGKIVLYPSAISAGSTIGITAHEIMHQKFQTLMNAARAEEAAIMQIKPPHGDRWDSVMKPDGSLREPYDKQFPLYQDWTTKYSMVDPKMFSDSDGVSDYSLDWWKAWKDQKASTHQAMHETLAEMARLKVQDEPIEHWGPRILSYRGVDTPKPTKKAEAAGAKVWRDLYDVIEKHYPNFSWWHNDKP